MAATITATLSSASANSYVTLAEANTYFETVPDSTTWDDKTVDQKNRALIAATRWIDTFVFYGDRCDNGQALKFPRNNYKVDDVELAYFNSKQYQVCTIRISQSVSKRNRCYDR